MLCKWTEEELSAAIAEHATGVSIHDIAKRKGVDRTSLYSLLKRRKAGVNYTLLKSPTWTAPTDPREIGYMAGLYDGEGALVRHAQSSKTSARPPLWMAAILMTSEPTIRWLGQFGGHVYFSPRHEKDPTRKDAWKWELCRQIDVRNFLRTVRPLLIVKAAAADIVLSRWTEQ